MELNEKLSSLRKNYGYSTRELATLLNVSQSSVSLWESGQRKPDYSNIIKLSEIYNVTIDYLLGSDSNDNKSKLKEINELINISNADIRMLEHQLGRLENELLSLKKSIADDTEYIDRSKKNMFKTFSTSSKEEQNITQIEKLILEEIKSKKRRCSQLENRLQHFENKLLIKKNEIKALQTKYEEETKVLHKLQKNLDKILKKEFNEIVINSEYELQMLIIDYLSLNPFFNESKIPVDQFISMSKNIIMQYFANNINFNKNFNKKPAE